MHAGAELIGRVQFGEGVLFGKFGFAGEPMKLTRAGGWVIAILVVAVLNGRAASADDQKTVAELDTQYQAAVKANDANVMDRILADDFILIEGDGKVSTKNDLLSEARSGRVVYEHQDGSEQTVRLWGDTAVVTAKLWGKGSDGGKPFNWTLWYSDTYVKTPGGWRYVFGQASLPLPMTPKAGTRIRPKSHVEIPPVVAAGPET
jgi:ketosteroid isomerase-like protein